MSTPDQSKFIGLLLPNGEPTKITASQFLDLYKMIVASSETLVGRRQGANTFFLSINGFLLTAIGLFISLSGQARLQAVGALVLGVTGALIAWVWRTLLISFGQLNTGKFRVISEMEKRLAAAIYSAEWEALEHAKNKKVYRTFTSREVMIPQALGVIYLMVMVISVVVALGWWHL
jgi:hypothetical protein